MNWRRKNWPKIKESTHLAVVDSLNLRSLGYVHFLLFSAKKKSLFNSVSHEFFLGTFWTYDVIGVCYEAFAYQGSSARWTNKTVIVPMASLEGYEPGATDSYVDANHMLTQKIHAYVKSCLKVLTSNWLGTSSATFGKKLSKTICTITLDVHWSKSLSSQRLLAMSTSEAFAMPRIVTVSNTALSDHLQTLEKVNRVSSLGMSKKCPILVLLA